MFSSAGSRRCVFVNLLVYAMFWAYNRFGGDEEDDIEDMLSDEEEDDDGASSGED